MNIFMQVFVWMQIFISLEWIFRRGVAGLNDKFFLTFLQNQLSI